MTQYKITTDGNIDEGDAAVGKQIQRMYGRERTCFLWIPAFSEQPKWFSSPPAAKRAVLPDLLYDSTSGLYDMRDLLKNERKFSYVSIIMM